MFLSIEEKDKIAVMLLKEYFETYKTNPIYVSQIAFKNKGINEDDIRLTLTRLEKQDLIVKYNPVKGCYTKTTSAKYLYLPKNKMEAEKRKNEVSEHFEIASSDYVIEDNEEEEEKAIALYTQPHYEVTINLEKIESYLHNKDDNKIKVYITEKGSQWIISKESGGELFYKPSSPTKKKIIKFFLKNKSKGFIETAKISSRLKIEPIQKVRTNIGKINTSFTERLKIHNKLILSEKPDGYSLNSSFDINYN